MNPTQNQLPPNISLPEKDNIQITVKNKKKIKKEIDYSVEHNKHYYNALFTRENSRRKMKKTFFWIIISAYCVINIVSLIILIYACFSDKNSAIFLVIGSLISLISTNISLPIIIAQNLFQSKENDNLQLYFDNFINDKKIENKSTTYENNTNEKLLDVQKMYKKRLLELIQEEKQE